MESSKVSSKFQVVIPSKIREQLDLKVGQRLVFIPYKKTVQLVVVPPIKEARGLFPGLDTTVDREDEDRV